MDSIEFIKSRKSFRQFKPEIPPREIIMECLDAAVWAPSPGNQQSSTFIVLTGSSLTQVCETMETHYAECMEKLEKIPEPPISPEVLSVFDGRNQETLSMMIADLSAHDVDLQLVGNGNFNFYYAPMAVLFATYPEKLHNRLKAAAAAMENFMLAATARGLGTCWMSAVSVCQQPIKDILKLDPDLILVDGVAVGYPAADSPLNQFKRIRLPSEQFVEWRD
jgi:nitroreductase